MELPKLNPNRAVDAILWDFDGVIARTENLHVAAWQRVVRHVEIGLPADAFKTAATEDDRDLVARVFESAGVSLHTSQVLSWCAAKQEVLIQLLKMAPPIYPSVPDVMRSIATQGIRQAIVTSTWRANVQATLGGSKLLELMEFIIAKEDVARPKPSPDGIVWCSETWPATVQMRGVRGFTNWAVSCKIFRCKRFSCGSSVFSSRIKRRQLGWWGSGYVGSKSTVCGFGRFGIGLKWAKMPDFSKLRLTKNRQVC